MLTYSATDADERPLGAHRANARFSSRLRDCAFERVAAMPVNIIHATLGVVFFMLWAIAGQILVRKPRR